MNGQTSAHIQCGRCLTIKQNEKKCQNLFQVGKLIFNLFSFNMWLPVNFMLIDIPHGVTIDINSKYENKS